MLDTVPIRLLAALVAMSTSLALAACGVDVRAQPAPDTTAPAAEPQAVVMIIRHGEKPDGTQPGVDAQGREDSSSLTATGWQRAHALVGLFDPAGGAPRSGLARPTAIYAAGATDEGEGKRTRETVAPLADALGLTVNTDFGRSDEKKLAKDVEKDLDEAGTGVALICWQHGGIPEIADAFSDVTPEPPGEWPDDRFDMVWVLTRAADGWHFSQVPQRVLPQDSSDPIAD